jgi:hypothetical protein
MPMLHGRCRFEDGEEIVSGVFSWNKCVYRKAHLK